MRTEIYLLTESNVIDQFMVQNTIHLDLVASINYPYPRTDLYKEAVVDKTVVYQLSSVGKAIESLLNKRVYRVSSDLYSSEELRSKPYFKAEDVFFPTAFNVLGICKQMQPDRIVTYMGGDPLEFTFGLNNLIQLPSDLKAAQSRVITEVKKKTEHLLESGVPYEGKRFSLAKDDKDNYKWMGDKITSGEWTTLPMVPLKYETLDHSYYGFQDTADLMKFIKATEFFIFTSLQSAVPVIESISATATLEELYAIVDNRGV